MTSRRWGAVLLLLCLAAWPPHHHVVAGSQAEALVVWGELLPDHILAAAGLEARGVSSSSVGAFFALPSHNGPANGNLSGPALLDALARGAADAAAVDTALASTPDLLQVPVLALGVAPVVNLNQGPLAVAAASTLVLSLQSLVGMFLGSVQSWDDPAVAALNAGPLPNHTITVFALEVCCCGQGRQGGGLGGGTRRRD